MLVQFKVGNYLSFKEPQTLSLVASSDDSLPQNTFPVPGIEGTSLLKSVAIYGANASGKSNLLKAFQFMREFVSESAGGQQGDRIAVTPFKLDPESQGQPSEFEVMFIHEGERYVYGFKADRERVHEEWLSATRIGARLRSRPLFHRGHGGNVQWGPTWRGERRKLEGMVRPNALLLSVAAQFANPIARPVFGWFSGLWAASSTELHTSRLVETREGFAGRLSDFMKMADTGIDSWRVDREPHIEPSRLDVYRDEERERLLKVFADWPTPKAIHRASDGRDVVFDLLTEESAGTIQLYNLAGDWLSSLALSWILLKDELEASLHPLLTRFLLRTAHRSDTTPQLVFTTHECSLLDRDLLRRDQIWFTEKRPDGSTELYSLWDFKVKPRQDEDFRGRYLRGRYGAIPYIGEWSFEQEEEPQTV